MLENPYRQWIGSDLALCSPVIAGEEIHAIPDEVGFRVFSHKGLGPRPKVLVDLEHLQLVDYAAFDSLSNGQRQQIVDLNAGDPVRPEEMVFLALKSLFQFIWPEPTSEDDIRHAAYYHAALNDVLASRAVKMAKPFASPEGLLPYWGRLAFLRVMGDLPYENVERFGLDRVACMLVKKPKFNAMTLARDDSAIICMNYALEPLLKHLNNVLLHFFDTKEMAGPQRLSRAWNALLPTVLHFWSDIGAMQLMQEPILLYEEATGILVHDLTADQLDFIVMHELGHVALDHPRRLKAEIDNGCDAKFVRHEFEFGADSFALGLMRSRFMNYAKSSAQQDLTIPNNGPSGAISGSLRDYQRRLGSVFLLFTYMDFIQRAGEMLRDRNDGSLRINSRMDTHPHAAARLERLELINIGEYLYTSPLQRYCATFFQSVLDHASGLDDKSVIDQARSLAQ